MAAQPIKDGALKPELLDEICYGRNFLTAVIARVDLVSPVESLAKELPKSIAEESLRSFPISEPRPLQAQEFRVVKGTLQAQAQPKEVTEWNFFGRDRTKRLTYGTHAFLISYDKYQRFESLREEFSNAVKIFFTHYTEAQPKRLGLRYINEIRAGEGDPLEWRTYIAQDLLGMFSYRAEGAEPSRIFHNLELVFAESDFNIRFQFGVYNPDYPATIRQRAFVLDFDAYHEGLIEVPDISASLDKYHAAIQRLFERSIGEKTREILNAAE